MNHSQPKDVWGAGPLYEAYVGRWSRLVAKEFVRCLSAPAGGDWLDVGCGTGALTRIILEDARPHTITGVDPSPGLIDFARTTIDDLRISLEVGVAQSLSFAATSFDLVVSGLMLNFVSQPGPAVAEMVRVTRLGGMVAAYVWDYAGKMELLRHFWDEVTLDPGALDLDEGRRFPIANRYPWLDYSNRLEWKTWKCSRSIFPLTFAILMTTGRHSWAAKDQLLLI